MALPLGFILDKYGTFKARSIGLGPSTSFSSGRLHVGTNYTILTSLSKYNHHASATMVKRLGY